MKAATPTKAAVPSSSHMQYTIAGKIATEKVHCDIFHTRAPLPPIESQSVAMRFISRPRLARLACSAARMAAVKTPVMSCDRALFEQRTDEK